jgi:hypothetical protein
MEEHQSQKQTHDYVVGIHSILDVWILDGVCFLSNSWDVAGTKRQTPVKYSQQQT